jgi:cyclin A
MCSDYEDDIDANLRLTERNPEERPRSDYLQTVQQDLVTPTARAALVGWMDEFVRHYDLAPARSTTPSPTSTGSCPCEP